MPTILQLIASGRITITTNVAIVPDGSPAPPGTMTQSQAGAIASQITNALIEVHDGGVNGSRGSQIFRDIISDYLSNPPPGSVNANRIEIEFVPGVLAAFPPSGGFVIDPITGTSFTASGRVAVDPSAVGAPGGNRLQAFNQNGELHDATFVRALTHELIHATLGFLDPDPATSSVTDFTRGIFYTRTTGQLDYAGPTVTLTNEILRDAQIQGAENERLSYSGVISSLDARVIQTGGNFTDGNAIDTAIVANFEAALGEFKGVPFPFPSGEVLVNTEDSSTRDLILGTLDQGSGSGMDRILSGSAERVNDFETVAIEL